MEGRMRDKSRQDNVPGFGPIWTRRGLADGQGEAPLHATLAAGEARPTWHLEASLVYFSTLGYLGVPLMWPSDSTST